VEVNEGDDPVDLLARFALAATAMAAVTALAREGTGGALAAWLLVAGFAALAWKKSRNPR
jgi:hypothetical protein